MADNKNIEKAREDFLDSLSPPEKAKMEAIRKEAQAIEKRMEHELKTTGTLSKETTDKFESILNKGIRAGLDPDGNGIVDKQHAEAIAKTIFSGFDEKMLTQAIGTMEDATKRDFGGIPITPETKEKLVLDGIAAGIIGQAERAGLKFPEDSIKVIRDALNPAVEVFANVSNKKFFDRGDTHVTTSGDGVLVGKDDGKVTELEMLKAINELNKGG